MKILLFGKNGQVGWELQRSLTPLGLVLALDRTSTSYCGDLTKPDELAKTVLDYRPDVIVNAAAHTHVDRAESEPALARLLNSEAPAALGKAAKHVGAWLVHYSSDYVFDGGGIHARREDDFANPLSVYGQTKLDGEKAIQTSGCNYLIFRTSWVFAARGSNFVSKILRMAQEREKLTVINDQHGAPTGADLIADVTAHAIRCVMSPQNISLGGTYHLAASGETTWHGIAKHVTEKAKLMSPAIEWKVKEIEAVPTTAFPTPAARPLNSRLCTDKLQHMFGIFLPAWQTGVDRMLTEIL